MLPPSPELSEQASSFIQQTVLETSQELKYCQQNTQIRVLLILTFLWGEGEIYILYHCV